MFVLPILRRGYQLWPHLLLPMYSELLGTRSVAETCTLPCVQESGLHALIPQAAQPNTNFHCRRCPCCSRVPHSPAPPTLSSGRWFSPITNACPASQDLLVPLIIEWLASLSLVLQLVQYLYDIPLILGHVWRLLFTAEGVALLCRLHILLLLLFLVLYLFSPLDLIPEAVFGALGLLDDLIILVAVATYVSQLYRNYITNG
jgi:hypothetical protein